MGKSYFLSETDNKTLDKIDFFSEMMLMPEEKLKKIILTLKKKYNINQPKLDIIIDPWSQNRPDVTATKKEVFLNKTPAADIYMRVMTVLCNYKVEKIQNKTKNIEQNIINISKLL